MMFKDTRSQIINYDLWWQ